MILVFWMLSFKPTFSLSSFTFIKRLLSSFSLSAIRVVLSAYLRLLIFLSAILIPACASSSLVFLMMYSAFKLNKQGDNIQPWCTLFLFGAFMENHFSRVYAGTTYHLQKSALSLSYTCSGRDTSTISKFTFKLFCHSLTSARNLIPQTFAFVVNSRQFSFVLCLPVLLHSQAHVIHSILKMLSLDIYVLPSYCPVYLLSFISQQFWTKVLVKCCIYFLMKYFLELKFFQSALLKLYFWRWP